MEENRFSMMRKQVRCMSKILEVHLVKPNIPDPHLKLPNSIIPETMILDITAILNRDHQIPGRIELEEKTLVTNFEVLGKANFHVF